MMGGFQRPAWRMAGSPMPAAIMSWAALTPVECPERPSTASPGRPRRRPAARRHVLFYCVGIAEALAGVRKAVLAQRVAAMRRPPARSPSSCRKGANSTADLGWARMALFAGFSERGRAFGLMLVLHCSIARLTNRRTASPREHLRSVKRLPIVGRLLDHHRVETTARCAHLPCGPSEGSMIGTPTALQWMSCKCINS